MVSISCVNCWLFDVGTFCIDTPLKKEFSPITENSPAKILSIKSSADCFVLSSLADISMVIRVKTVPIFSEIIPSVNNTAYFPIKGNRLLPLVSFSQ